MQNIRAYESFFVSQQLLVTGVVIAAFIFGVVYLVHRIGLENREIDEANKEKEKEKDKNEEKKEIKTNNKEVKKNEDINKKKATSREEILARFVKPVEEKVEVSKETNPPTEEEGKQMVEEAVETASVFGDTTIAIDADETKKPENVVKKPQPKAKDKKEKEKEKGESNPKNVVKKPQPKNDAPKVDIMGEL